MQKEERRVGSFSRPLHYKPVPLGWLSCPPPSKLISCDALSQLSFMVCKTPLPQSYVSAISPKSPWIVKDVIDKAKSLSDPNNSVRLMAINTSSSSDVIPEDDWRAFNVPFLRIATDYKPERFEAFCKSVDDELSKSPDNHLICIIYSGRGLNRSIFAVAGYISRHGPSISDAVKLCLDSNPNSLWKSTALTSLSSIFDTKVTGATQGPEWLDKPGPSQRNIAIYDIPLSLEKFGSLRKKIPRYAASRNPVTGRERDRVMDIILKSTDDWDHCKGNPVYHLSYFKPACFGALRCQQHFASFEPRGVRGFLVVWGDWIYCVDSGFSVWTLKRRDDCKRPVVATCTIVEERKRCLVFLTDLLVFGETDVASLPLSERLAYLANRLLPKLRAESLSECGLLILFRPVTELKNVVTLEKDLGSLCVKCDGIAFYGNEERPGHGLLLPMSASVLLYVNLCGKQKAVLVGKDNESDVWSPVAVYQFANEKMAGLDGRTSRFEYRAGSREWKPVCLGQSDDPSSIVQIREMVESMGLEKQIPEFLREIQQISYG
jgi:hypothetical protein